MYMMPRPNSRKQISLIVWIRAKWGFCWEALAKWVQVQTARKSWLHCTIWIFLGDQVTYSSESDVSNVRATRTAWLMFLTMWPKAVLMHISIRHWKQSSVSSDRSWLLKLLQELVRTLTNRLWTILKSRHFVQVMNVSRKRWCWITK